MDITNFDLIGLQSLHIGFVNVLTDHENYLEEIKDKEEITGSFIEALNRKIEYFKNMIKVIENRINELNSEQLRISAEYLFLYYGLTQKSIQIHFITTSNAYKEYGAYVTGTVKFDESEYEELLKSIENKGHNDGVIKFEPNITDSLKDEAIEKLQSKGFYASEIDHFC